MVSAAVLASGRKPRGRLADLMIASIAIVNRITAPARSLIVLFGE
jgi:predicted nucleic acid-binding protein